MSDDQKILTSSAVMAAGTVVSRMSGFVRSALLIAALGNGLHGELFNIANTVPNMLYILLAGGVFNAVLVPQLVRALKNDPDGGQAYTDRVVSLAGLFLALVTVLLVLTAPWVMQIFLSDAYDQPELAAQLESVNNFARWCLPQVFFYGMFVLVGQILNARGRFGPMMWAPIANNVVAIATLVTYLLVYGTASAAEQGGAFTPGQEALLGLGSTLGIVLQLAVLVPYLRSAGYRFHPRVDFRDAGLGHTLRLGVWTLLFVLVNQVAYAVVVRLASSGPAETLGNDPDATGYLVYSATFLIVMVPHSVVTVSLATAVLPRMSALAAEGDHPELARTLMLALRNALVVIVPFALLLPLVSLDVAHVIWGYGAGSDHYANFSPSLARVRVRPGLLHHPLRHAARLLRPRADPHRLPDPVRHRRRQRDRGAAAGPRGDRRADLARPGRRLRRGLPRGCGGLLDGPGAPAARRGPGPARAGRLRVAAGRGLRPGRRGGVRRGAAAARGVRARPRRRPRPAPGGGGHRRRRRRVRAAGAARRAARGDGGARPGGASGILQRAGRGRPTMTRTSGTRWGGP